MLDSINIPKAKLKGEDNYKTFSIRIPAKLYEELSELSNQTDLSRNEVITILLKEACSVATVTETK